MTTWRFTWMHHSGIKPKWKGTAARWFDARAQVAREHGVDPQELRTVREVRA